MSEKVLISDALSVYTYYNNSQSYIKSEQAAELKGCCAFLSAYPIYETIVFDKDITLTEEQVSEWIEDITTLFPMKIEEVTDIFRGITEEYSSGLIFRLFDNNSNLLNLLEKVVDILYDNRKEFFDIILKHIKSSCTESKVIFKVSPFRSTFVIPQESFFKEIVFHEDISKKSFVGMTKVIYMGILYYILSIELLKVGKKETLDLYFKYFSPVRIFPPDGNYIRDGELFNTNGFEYFIIHSAYSTGIGRTNDPTRFWAASRLYNTPDQTKSGIEIWKEYVEKMGDIIINSLKEDINSVTLSTNKVYRVSTKKLTGLQCHTLIRALWEKDGKFVKDYLKIKKEFPNMDPYFLLSISSRFLQRSGYGNIQSTDKTTFHYVKNAKREDIIRMKNKYEHLEVGVMKHYDGIFSYGASEVLKLPDRLAFSSKLEQPDELLKFLKTTFNENT